jgi:coatomer subunit beta
VTRGVLWIIGEYVEGPQEIEVALGELRKVIGEIPIGASEQRVLEEAGEDAGDVTEKEPAKDKEKVSARPKILADGTYATETAYTSTAAVRLEAVKAASKPPLRGESLLFPMCVH